MENFTQVCIFLFLSSNIDFCVCVKPQKERGWGGRVFVCAHEIQRRREKRIEGWRAASRTPAQDLSLSSTEGWITQPVLHHQSSFSLLTTRINGKETELSQQQRQAQVRPQDHFCLQSTDLASPSVSPQCQPGYGHPVWCPRAQPG